MRLDSQFESSSARIDLTRRPWWRKILASLTDPEVRSITVMASTQVGKTLTLIAALIYLAEHDPSPAMIVLPDEASAIEFRDRLYANAAATVKAGQASRIQVPKPWRWNRRWADLGTMRVYLAWSQARQRLRGRPCRRVFLSEIDVYEGHRNAGDPVAQSHQRTKAFLRYLHYHESSPTEHPSPISTLESKAAVRYRWFATCPHCGHQQELRFFRHDSGPFKHCGGIAGYRDAAGELLSGEQARAAAHYLCEKGCRIDECDRMRFICKGEWRTLGNAAAGAKVAALDRRTLGFHLWAIHSETQTFGELAISYVDASNEGKLRDWWGNMLGLPHRPQQKIPLWYEVGTRLAAAHPRGMAPAEAWFLTFGMDVQADFSGCRYVVRGWAPKRTSWLVEWGWIEPVPGEELSLVRSDLRRAGELVLETQFPIHGGGSNPLGFTSLPVRLGCCDSNHSPRDVHSWMRSLPESWVVGEGSERVRAIRGDHQLNGVRFQRSVVERNTRTGEAYEGGMVVWRLSVAEIYPDLVERLFAPAHQPGSWHVTADAVTLGKSYLQQVCNLERRIVIDKHGRKKIEWGPRSHQIPIDFADCEVYAEFAAEMVVGSLGWEPQAWEIWRQQQQAAQQQQRANAGRRTAARELPEDLSAR